MSARRAARRAAERQRRRPRTAAGLLAIAVAAAAALAVLYIAAVRPAGVAPATAPDARSAVAGQGTPSLSVTPTRYDLGEVSQARGIVTVELAVTNQGTGPLVIAEMETSCGCTRAALVTDGRVGPWFGMRGHGEWPRGWSATLAPGARATLRVQYDPDAHGIYRGPIDRLVYIYSNDPRQPRTEVRLTGTQVP